VIYQKKKLMTKTTQILHAEAVWRFTTLIVISTGDSQVLSQEEARTSASSSKSLQPYYITLKPILKKVLLPKMKADNPTMQTRTAAKPERRRRRRSQRNGSLKGQATEA
jgi:hypothetical protein